MIKTLNSQGTHMNNKAETNKKGATIIGLGDVSLSAFFVRELKKQTKRTVPVDLFREPSELPLCIQNALL